MTSALPLPWYQRINFRMLIVAAIILIPIGCIGYLVLDQLITHGIHKKGDLLEVDLKQISLFEMDQVTATDASIPPEFRALDGKRVMVTGEMYTGSGAGSKQRAFDMVFSIQKCCLTSAPKIQHFVKCSVSKDRRIEYYPGLVRAVGVLHVGVKREGGTIGSVYRMDIESVEPAE